MDKFTCALRWGFVFLIVFSPCAVRAGRPAQWLRYSSGDFLFDFKVDHKAEAVYAKNSDYFSGSPFDQYSYAQSTWDFTTHTRFSDIINSKLTLREKVRWGETRSILTTADTISVADVTIDGHQHGFNRLVPWFRKAWVKFSLNDAFSINTDRRHYFKFGIFPFEVGRGISLGAAYAVSPGMLGFFVDNTIDQYAFGALLHGDVSAKHDITYDAYVSIVENLSNSLSRNTESVYQNCFTAPTAYRGYGAPTFILVGKLLWTLFDTKNLGSLNCEPYVVYLHHPHNKIEFKSGAAVTMGTVGFAVEYAGPKFELGFETATNIGHQFIRAWDRNAIIANRNTETAAIEEVYSHVFTDSSYANKAPVTNSNKDIVAAAPLGVVFNGERIGNSTLYNGRARFRPAYYNKLGGLMVVADAAYWLKPDELKVAATVAFASGEENPNVVLDRPEDTEYTDTYGGFVGLQEIYSGKRVRSLFVLGGVGVPRPLTAPALTVDSTRQRYASSSGGFTNLVYTGLGLTWTPKSTKKKCKVMPNVLYYWQDQPVKAYCLTYHETATEKSRSLDYNASRALGLEINTFADMNFLDNLKGFAAFGVFVPGPHYDQVVGKPTNSNQYKEVTNSARYGIDYNAYPLLNNKPSFALDIGFEYLF